MHLYLAAVYSNNYKPGQARYEKLEDNEREIVCTVPHILESYHYVGKQRYVDEMRADGAQIFLDSGAFSAKSLGVDINIDEYCNYIIRNKDIIRVEDGVLMASVLDGIGNDLLTYQNQIYMEQRGAKPLPCFHFGEDERYLEWYVANYPYITIGGLVRTKAEDVMNWLDRIWSKYMLDGSGKPKLKVHAFGVTTVSLMERYPWYSVDSSSWIQAAAFGAIFTAKHGPIPVSTLSPSRHDAGRHLCNITNIERDSVDKMLALHGFTYDRLSTVYESRAAYNMLGYCELNQQIDAELERCGNVLQVSKAQQLF